MRLTGPFHPRNGIWRLSCCLSFAGALPKYRRVFLGYRCGSRWIRWPFNKEVHMKLFTVTAISLLVLASPPARADDATQSGANDASAAASDEDSQTIRIMRSGSHPSREGPAEYFTGSARIDPLFVAETPSRASASYVTFEPGARTAWHTHPLGQVLIVTAGTGLVQRWGGPIEEFRAGDVVRIPPGVKHWHGASPTSRMTHIAIQEELDGKNVEWMEKVTDEQYAQASATSDSTELRRERK
jgi:quercetin dioxygenase-like cupin family protein